MPNMTNIYENFKEPKEIVSIRYIRVVHSQISISVVSCQAVLKCYVSWGQVTTLICFKYAFTYICEDELKV